MAENRKSRLPDNLKKKSLIIKVCLLMLLMAVVGMTYAAYTSRSFTKGVATSPRKVLFLTSDYLSVIAGSTTSENYPVRKILMDERDPGDTSDFVFGFNIQNTNGGVISSRQMQYTIYVEGLEEGMTVARDGNNVTSDVKTGCESPLMTAGVKTTHAYTITVPASKIADLGNLKVYAVPSSDSDSSGNILAAKLQFSTAGHVATFSAVGYYADSSVSTFPYQFAAFNYDVTITNAAEDHSMVLSWDTDKVEIDPQFLKLELGLSEAEVSAARTAGSVTFTMNAEHSGYLIQFYRVTGRDASESWQKTWVAMEASNVITFGTAD